MSRCMAYGMSSVFEFSEYSTASDRRCVRLVYRCRHEGAEHVFTETVTFPVRLPDTAVVDHLVRLLHIAAGTSYYKLFVPPHMAHPYTMSRAEAAFWNEVYRLGLREFMYINRIPDERIARFPEGPAAEDGSAACAPPRDADTALLGIGGGKDSIVAGEVLKAIGVPLEGFVVVPADVPAPVLDVAHTMGVDLLVVRRKLDTGLKRLAAQPGAYNGHIPVSVIFAIIGCLVAVARGHRYVAVGNERSASIPGMTWQGLAINHQWSKSLRFEKLLQQRLAALGAPVNYFSPVRSLDAIAIAGLFAAYADYFRAFSSDSSVFRIDQRRHPTTRWSVDSAKSLSSYILLWPWIEEGELQAVFGRDFLDDVEREPMLMRLLGVSLPRELDCVGTPDELRVSIEAALAQGKGAASRLIPRALNAGAVVRRDNALRRLAAHLAVARDHAFPAGLTDELSRAIRAQLRARHRLVAGGVARDGGPA